MTDNMNLDEIEKCSNILATAVSHIDTSKEMFDDAVLKLDNSLLEDLPISEIKHLADEYISCVNFVKSRLESIINAHTLAVYAPPDILFGNDNTKLFK